MRYALALVAAITAGLALPAASAAAPPPAFVPGEVIVGFDAGAGPALHSAARNRLGATWKANVGTPAVELLRLAPTAPVQASAARLERLPGVRYAEPNYLLAPEATPNDQYFPLQWAHLNTGQTIGSTTGVPGADMRTTQGWDLSTGSPATTIAIVDTGVGLEQPDIAPNLWTNPGETGGGRETNGIDDDGDGLVDDWRGWDFARNTNDPHDTFGHGTGVAGVIAARGNDGYGIAGVNWSSRLMTLRAGLSNDQISAAAAAAAFRYAAAKGARVVNGSFGSYTFSQAMFDAVTASPNTLFVFSAGNDATDNDVRPHYPSGFRLPNVLSVAATDQTDNLASFSNFGATSVDVAAPGRNVITDALAIDTILTEGFETGNVFSDVFPASGRWATTTAAAASGAYSLTDSPSATYPANSSATATTASSFSLAGRHNCQLDFKLRRDFGTGDGLFVDASTNGTTWVQQGLGLGGSTAGAFAPEGYDLSAYDGLPQVYLRFRLYANNDASTGDGAYVDNVAVRCYPAAAPSAPGVAYVSGTSIAAPQVTGAAGLLFAQNPFRTVADVRALLLNRADRLPQLAGKVATGARLNVYQSLRDLTPPVLGPVTVAPRRLTPITHGSSISHARRGGTVISTSLSEAGTITFGVLQLRPGRRAGRACRAPTRANRRRHRCTRTIALRGAFSQATTGGAVKLRFSGRLRGRTLPKGSYKLVATAIDAAGNRAAAVRPTPFSVKAVRRRR